MATLVLRPGLIRLRNRVNEAYERVLASDVRYRFVIDTATLRR